MKVLNVNDMLNPITGGGTAERTFQMSRALVRAGLECAILTADSDLSPDHRRDSGATIISFPSISKRFFIPRINHRTLVEAIRGADIVHLMGHWSLLNAAVYLFTSRLGKPYVVCPAGALPVYGRSKRLKRIYNLAVGRKLVQRSARCIAVTAAEIPQFEAYNIPREKVVVIPNGITLEDLPEPNPTAFREEHGLGSQPIVLFVGRLNHIKGPDLLLQAFCNLKDILNSHLLVFAGPDGGMLGALMETARRCKLKDRVRFLGYVGGAEKYQACYASDLLVIPSRQEAMSIVVLEAGITQTPVLLTNQCGFNEVAENHGGRVVEATVSALQQGLSELLSDPAKLAQMGVALKTYVSQNYIWDKLAAQCVALYEQIVTERTAPALN